MRGRVCSRHRLSCAASPAPPAAWPLFRCRTEVICGYLYPLSFAAAPPEGQGKRVGAGGCRCLCASGSRAWGPAGLGVPLTHLNVSETWSGWETSHLSFRDLCLLRKAPSRLLRDEGARLGGAVRVHGAGRGIFFTFLVFYNSCLVTY